MGQLTTERSERDLGYVNKDRMQVGELVTVNRDVRHAGATIRPGDRAFLRSFSSDGSNGISAIIMPIGQRTVRVPAGVLVRAGAPVMTNDVRDNLEAALTFELTQYAEDREWRNAVKAATLLATIDETPDGHELVGDLLELAVAHELV